MRGMHKPTLVIGLYVDVRTHIVRTIRIVSCKETVTRYQPNLLSTNGYKNRNILLLVVRNVFKLLHLGKERSFYPTLM